MRSLRGYTKLLLSRLAYIFFRPSFEKSVFVIAHMRCGSSALSQVMSSHEGIAGLGETHIAYDSHAKLGLLYLSLLKNRIRVSPSDLLLDKVLHNRYDEALPDQFFDSRAIFLIREPVATIHSITNLFGKIGSSEYATHKQSAEYYIERVRRMMKLWAEFPESRRLFIPHERLMSHTDECLADISSLLELSQPLQNKYSSAVKIRRGSGDPLVSTSLSKITTVKPTKRPDLIIESELIAKAHEVYLEALSLFGYHQSTLQGTRR